MAMNRRKQGTYLQKPSLPAHSLLCQRNVTPQVGANLKGPLLNCWNASATAKVALGRLCWLPAVVPVISSAPMRSAAVSAGQPYPSHTCAFVKTHKVGVCRGPYPQLFIKAWRAWDKRNTSENDPVADHPKDQLYAVFAMADCGRDLEGYQLRGFDQARSMMLQVMLFGRH